MLRAVRVMAAACAALAAVAVPCAAADEPDVSLSRLELDRTFGRRGIARTGGLALSFKHVAVDSEGRVYVAGELEIDSLANSEVPGVLRFLPDGTLDPSFAWGGPGDLFRGSVHDMVVDAQDRVVIVGDLEGPRRPEIGAIRIRPDGAEDATFSEDGTVESPGENALEWPLVRLQADGVSLFAAAERGLAIVKLDAAGEFDASFAEDGVFAVEPDPQAGTATQRVIGIAADAAGGVVVASEHEVFRLLPDGSRDPSFGAGGRLAGPSGGRVHAFALEGDAQGRLVVRASEGDSPRVALFRFLADGSLDASFASDGRAEELLGHSGDAQVINPKFAVSSGADRVVYASGLQFRERHGRSTPGGEWIQTIGLDAPEAVRAYTAHEASTRRQPRLIDVCFTPDGAAAYVVGSTLLRPKPGVIRVRQRLMRVDLAPQRDVRLPDLAVEFAEQPHADGSSGWVTVHGAVRVTNRGPARSGGGTVSVFVTQQPTHEPGDEGHHAFQLTVRPLARGRSRVLPFDLRMEAPEDLSAHRVAAIVGTTMQSDVTNDVAVSAPLSSQ